MRILNIMLARVKGGVETMAVHYHTAMVAEGHEVLSLGHPEGALATALDARVFRPLNARFNHDPMAMLQLRRYVRDFRPDLVLAHGNRAAGLCLLPFTGLADRTVQVMHNNFSKGHLGRVRAAFCVSASVREHVAAAFPGTLLFQVDNFAPLVEGEVKAAPAGRPVIGVLGRLHEQKGFDILIRAAALLRDDGIDFELRIGGEGPMREELQALVATFGLGDRVTFCGWIEPGTPYLSGLDLFVVPSRYEPFGLVVIEAMAMGLPVVASANEGPREILCDGRYGRMFPNEDPVALAAVLKDALGDWTHMLDLARAGKAHVLDTYGLRAGQRRLAAALAAI